MKASLNGNARQQEAGGRQRKVSSSSHDQSGRSTCDSAVACLRQLQLVLALDGPRLQGGGDHRSTKFVNPDPLR
jgi:hypothetical protein